MRTTKIASKNTPDIPFNAAKFINTSLCKQLNHQTIKNHKLPIKQKSTKYDYKVIDFQKYHSAQSYTSIKSNNFYTEKPAFNKILTTLMFTDIIDSTQKVFKMGNQNWLSLLQHHRFLIRRQIKINSGIELEAIGDGFFVNFNCPDQAVNCACKIQSDMKSINLPIRIGIHVGEVLLTENDCLSGLAIHIASRITAKAYPYQVVTSHIVKDIATDSKKKFIHIGDYPLKGLPNNWSLFSVI